MYNKIPTVKPVFVYGGDTLAREYRLRDAERNPIDFSDWVFTAEWLSQRTSLRLNFEVDAAESHQGNLILKMTSEQTESMESDGRFDLQGVKGETSKTFFKGKTEFTQGVTRG